MSWFDTAGIANFAKSALTTAQKTIDKALDIQEEKGIKRDNVSKLPETDNFFEAFGLNDKPSSSQPEIKSFAPQNVVPESNLQQASVQGSGFWTDTWGSFFEMKGPISTQTDSNTEIISAENSSPEGSSRKENTVLSQPHRASLFPNDPNQTLTPEKIDTVNVSQPPVIIHDIKTLDKELKDCVSESSNIVLSSVENKDSDVTIQLSSDCVPSLQNEDMSVISSLNIKENSNKVEKSDFELSETDCNKDDSACSHKDSKDLDYVPMPVTVPDNDKTIDVNQYHSIPVAIDSPNVFRKVESEYDVIEMSDSDVSNSVMEISSDSFTRSASVEVVTSASQCSSYDISNSTIDIPDLPENIAGNLVAWEWSAMENISSNVYVTPSESSKFQDSGNVVSQSLQMINSDASFHTITASSFTDKHLWAKNDTSSHFIDESPNSSNEEQNSHHSDGSSNSSKDDDDTDTAEVKEYDAKSSSSNGSGTTSSSSFVKCSADDNDNSSHRGPSPISTTASERSDVTKHESEQNTSGDENETATSSDIEILSPPNGENNERNSSPLKHIWLPRPLRLRRSESPTSDSSKDSLMPVVNELEEVCSGGDLKSSSLYSKDEGIHHKIFSEDSSLGKLLQKQEELQTVLEAREKKIVELSKENIELQENELRLKNLVQKMRVEQAKESRDIAALTKEFTQRLSLVENQLKEATKERDNLQIELEEAKKEIAKRICAADLEEEIKEKDLQIKELTEEGQKLSKKELQHTTIIKKLRAKEDEMEKTIKSQAEKLEENSKEVERLRKSIGAKEEQEKKHIDAIRQLTNSIKKLEKEVATLKSNLEDSTEKELSLKKSLDSTYKDLTDVRKSYSNKEKELEDLKSGLEVEANENLRQLLENAQKDANKEKEMLLLQIQELRCTLSRFEEEANLREKMYKADISSLQKRLQEAEERNEDLTKNVSSATRPLVRQIENLQATYNAQTISWEKIEKNLTDRLSDTQNQLAFMYEKERSATEKYMEYQSKITAYEAQNNNLRQEKLQLTSEIETLKAKIIVLEENKSRETYTLQKLKDNFNTEIGKLKKEKAGLESTMATCLEQLEAEKKKVAKLEEEIKFKEARALIMSNVSRSSSPTGSVRSSVSSIHNWSHDEIPEQGASTPVNSYRMSVYESLRLGSGSSLLENLQSQLKQREGEIIQLQSEIVKLEQVKESMTRELVQLSEQNEQYETKLNKLELVEKEYKDLDQKYNTLLQMYGEKVEETEELQLDLADVKTMYKAQIEELLRSK